MEIRIEFCIANACACQSMPDMCLFAGLRRTWPVRQVSRHALPSSPFWRPASAHINMIHSASAQPAPAAVPCLPSRPAAWPSVLVAHPSSPCQPSPCRASPHLPVLSLSHWAPPPSLPPRRLRPPLPVLQRVAQEPVPRRRRQAGDVDRPGRDLVPPGAGVQPRGGG